VEDPAIRFGNSSSSSSASTNPKSEIRDPKLEVKLTDFGIGQVVSQEALAGMTRMGFTQTMLSPGSSSQTGTHLYMAPELLAGKPASTRSDIYSLGVVLYQLLIGDFTRPLTTDWVKRIADLLLQEDLAKCFAGEPEERFASAHELSTNLRSLETRRTKLVARQKTAQRRRVASIAAIATTILAAVTSIGIFATKQARPPTGRPPNATHLRRPN
jgi:non-specific serine/threonine protein kinase